MKNHIYYLLIIFSLTACTKLDIPPMNVVQDKDIFSNPEGIRAYMARIYSEMPLEDFRYSPSTGFNSSFYGPPSAITGEAISRDQASGTESFAYWAAAYDLIRDCNYFIATLPEYSENFSEVQVSNWLGEAHFVRGVTYLALAKRYGGVPIVDELLTIPGESIDELAARIDELNIPRSSEEAVWDFIGADFDYAFENLPASNETGRATKYAAAAFKSRAMLYAGSIAKYNQIELVSDGVMVVGIPESKAVSYFQKSYDAALLLEGKFSLYVKDWSANNKEAQFENFVNLFFDPSSPENIFVRQYKFPESVHGYDAMNLPRQLSGAGNVGSETNPTLDFVEMFDGIPKNPDGTIRTLDAEGNYILYEQTMDLFAQAEPRLRATVILPGDIFKKESIEIRRGIYTGGVASGIDKLLPKGSTSNYPTSEIVSSSIPPQTPYQLPNGTLMNPAGLSGVFTNREAGGSISGFSIRKYLNPDMPTSEVSATTSDQTWIEMRYAEVLLNRAEAAYELYNAGKGANYQLDAFEIINKIRERAGATLLEGPGELSVEVIRTERRKELAFENKIYWDLRRWRIYDELQNGRIYRVLMPFYSSEAGKYFFDPRFDERNTRYTFLQRWYYNPIPQGAISKNVNLIQNPGY